MLTQPYYVIHTYLFLQNLVLLWEKKTRSVFTTRLTPLACEVMLFCDFGGLILQVQVTFYAHFANHVSGGTDMSSLNRLRMLPTFIPGAEI